MLPVAVDGFNGKGLIVTVKVSDEILFPQLLTALTEIFAIPLKLSVQSIIPILVVLVKMPAIEGYTDHKNEVAPLDPEV